MALVGQPRDEALATKLKVARDQLWTEALSVDREAKRLGPAEGADLADKAAKMKADARAADDRYLEYMAQTADLRAEYSTTVAAMDLEARRAAPGKAAAAQKKREERDQRLKEYPTMRGSYTRDKSVGADPPEFPTE